MFYLSQFVFTSVVLGQVISTILREVIIKKNESVDFVQTFLDPLPAPLKFGHQNRIILLSPFELSNFYRIYIVHV